MTPDKQAKIDAVTTSLAGYQIGDRVELLQPYGSARYGTITATGNFNGYLVNPDGYGAGLQAVYYGHALRPL